MFRVADKAISWKVNYIHEFSHIIHNQFFSKELFLCEGFAEAFLLYVLNYEEKVDEHREVFKELDEIQVFSVNELIELEAMEVLKNL